jgi:hypothetical protein
MLFLWIALSLPDRRSASAPSVAAGEDLDVRSRQA